MDSILEALDRVRSASVAFLRTPKARVLGVTLDEQIRGAAIETLAQIEWHPANRCQVIVVDADASSSSEDLWRLATERVEQAHGGVRRAYARARMVAREEQPRESSQNREELIVAFARAIASISSYLRAIVDGPDGLLVIVAPQSVRDPEAIATGLATVIDTPRLAAVRWVCAGESPFISALRARIDKGQMSTCEARVDQASRDAEVDAILSSISGGGRPGCGAPVAAVPAHPSDPPGAAATNQPAAGLSPKARESLVEGVRAIRRRDALTAIRHQRRVCDVCLADRRVDLAVEMELLLASYAIQACFTTGAPAQPAIHLLQSVVTRATASRLHLAVAKANYLLGTLATATNDDHLAGQAFRRAATAADLAGSPALKIAALRAAGERLLALGLRKSAAAIFTEAASCAISSSPPDTDSLQPILRRLNELGVDHPSPGREQHGPCNLDMVEAAQPDRLEGT